MMRVRKDAAEGDEEGKEDKEIGETGQDKDTTENKNNERMSNSMKLNKKGKN
jgi:hypothetical protein